jgi:hypothetical protein
LGQRQWDLTGDRPRLGRGGPHHVHRGRGVDHVLGRTRYTFHDDGGQLDRLGIEDGVDRGERTRGDGDGQFVLRIPDPAEPKHLLARGNAREDVTPGRAGRDRESETLNRDQHPAQRSAVRFRHATGYGPGGLCITERRQRDGECPDERCRRRERAEPDAREQGPPPEPATLRPRPALSITYGRSLQPQAFQ